MVLTAVLNSWPTSMLVDEQKIAVIPTTHLLLAVGFSVRKAFSALSPFPPQSIYSLSMAVRVMRIAVDCMSTGRILADCLGCTWRF